jgi:hypothetical protein
MRERTAPPGGHFQQVAWVVDVAARQQLGGDDAKRNMGAVRELEPHLLLELARGEVLTRR